MHMYLKRTLAVEVFHLLVGSTDKQHSHTVVLERERDRWIKKKRERERERVREKGKMRDTELWCHPLSLSFHTILFSLFTHPHSNSQMLWEGQREGKEPREWRQHPKSSTPSSTMTNISLEGNPTINTKLFTGGRRTDRCMIPWHADIPWGEEDPACQLRKQRWWRWKKMKREEKGKRQKGGEIGL